jgi:hypothetical protein
VPHTVLQHLQKFERYLDKLLAEAVTITAHSTVAAAT